MAGGVERWAGREQGALGQDDSHRRWEHLAAPAAAQAAEELCTLAAVQFAERSFAGPGAAEQQAALQLEARTVRMRKLRAALRLKAQVAREAALPVEL
jgi:ribosomal protein S11